MSYTVGSATGMAQTKTISTKEFSGTRVVGGKKGTRRIGKIRRFVFHPSEKRCVGFIVKRPDFLLMFRRKDQFLAFDRAELVDGRILMPYKEKDALDASACKRLGIDWDSCVMWEAMPIIAENGEECGIVGDIAIYQHTGKVKSITVDKGATAKVLLGQVEIPVSMVMGFKTGIGKELVGSGGDDEDAPAMRGGILVSDEVLQIAVEGGLAEKAGKDAAIAQDKARQVKEKAKPKVDKAARETEKAINKGAYATGRQIHKAKGMFSAFKDEYDKAVSDDDAKSIEKR